MNTKKNLNSLNLSFLFLNQYLKLSKKNRF